MTSFESTRTRRRLPATLILSAAVLGASVAGAAAAPAKTIKWDPAKYANCSAYWYDQHAAGKITEKEWDQAARLCCASSGGDVVTYPNGTWRCAEPVEFTPGAGRPVTRIPTEVLVPTGELTPLN